MLICLPLSLLPACGWVGSGEKENSSLEEGDPSIPPDLSKGADGGMDGASTNHLDEPLGPGDAFIDEPRQPPPSDDLPPDDPPADDPPSDDPPPEGPVLVTTVARVSHSTDDAEELLNRSNDGYPRGWIYMDSSDLELIYDDRYDMNQIIGMRFPDLDVPQGVTITNAYVRFTAEDANGGSTSLRISGQAAGNAGRFTTTYFDVSSRPRTNAVVQWNNLPAWSTGERHNSPDLSAVIQEIVNRGNWSRGNALVLFVHGSGQRTAESYDGSWSGAPRLHVQYEAP
jgi:hypothetical protein